MIMIISTVINFTLPIISKSLIDNGILKGNFQIVLKYSILSFLLVIIDQGLSLFETRTISYSNNLFRYRLTSISIRKLMKAKMSYLDDNNFTEIVNNIQIDVNNVSRLVDQSFITRIFNVFKILGGFLGMLTIDYRLSVLVVLILPIRYFFVNYFSKIKKKDYKEYMEYSKQYFRWYGDKMDGLKEIKLSGIESIIMKQFTKLQRWLIRNNIKREMTDKLNRVTESITMKLISTIIYIIGALMIISGSFTIGGLFAFSTYSVRVISPISSLLNIKYDFAKIILSAERLFNFLDMDCEISDEEFIRLQKKDLKGEIDLRNISFSYDSNNEALKNVNFNIKSGEKVGLVGLNGSGKSTIFNLLLKICKPSKGEIYLDGINIENIKIRDLRKGISIVTQDIHLFNTTIEENISLFSKLSDEKINQSIKLSGAYDFISKIPKNAKNRIGVKGTKLSGGEKQKIAIARAFSKSCNIMLFDEATSSFDIKSEKQFNDSVLENFKENTAIFITHRPNILKELDKIIVLHKGEVVDIGVHDELLSRNHEYIEIIKTFENKYA